MSQLYTVTTGVTALVAATAKVAVALYTGALTQLSVVQVDVTFDGVNAGAVPVKMEFVKTSGSSAGGSIYTPLLANTAARVAASTVARINDTTDGASPIIQQGYHVPPSSGLALQFPLGREPGIAGSSFWELRLTAPAAVNYLANVWFEE